MDERSAGRLRIVFRMVYQNQCVIAEIEKSDTVIVNVEKQSAETVLSEFKENYPDKPAILLCDSDVSIDGIKCITRPFKLPELLESLKQTSLLHSEQITASAIKNARQTASSLESKLTLESDNNKPVKTIAFENKDVYYQPDNFLQGKVTSAIKKANKQNISVFLRCWSHRWIVVSPSSGFLVENIKERQLTNLGLVNTDSDVVFREESFSEKQMLAMSETPLKEVKVTSIQKFIWDIAVRTARGRIPQGTSRDALYILEQWPNLTRLAKVPNSMRISAFWLEQALTINDVVKKLNIPVKDVFTYFSAASAAGLIKQAKRQEDRLLEPDISKVNKSKKSLFSAILRKLGKISHSAIKKVPQVK